MRRKGLGQTAKVWRILQDGRPHSIQEIHAAVGPCRLNSRVAEARKRFGADIECRYEDGTYVYQYRPLPERSDAIPEAPSPLRSDSGQLSLVESLRLAPEAAPAVAATLDSLDRARRRGPVAVPPLADRDEAYASRLADRLRAEDAHRRLRVVGGGDAA